MLLVQQRPSHLRIGGHSHSRTTCHSHLRGQNGLSAQRNSNGKPLARVKQESGHHSVGLACVLAGLIGFVLPSSAVEDMAASFQKNCAGCHAGGGNIVQRGAGLSLQELQKNGAISPEEIYKLVYFGKGKMPGYGQGCAPRGKCTFAARLGDQEIEQLSSYVLDKARTGWIQ